MIKSMKPNSGRMAIVLPHGVLFRKGAEGRIRQELIEKDILEAVIGLGANIFYGTQLAACILVFSQNKKKDKKDNILFIDASEQIRVGRAQNFLDPEHVNHIYNWYKSFQDVENFVKVITISEIADNEYNLNIPLYVEKKIEDNLPSVEQALSDLKQAWKESQKADEELILELSKWSS